MSESKYEEIISAIGYVEYDKEMTIRSEVGGIIKSMVYEESDRVNKGDVILTIDDTDARLIYDSLQLSVTLTEARLKDYKVNYNNAYSNVANQQDVYNQEKEALMVALRQLDDDINQTTTLVKKGVKSQTELDKLLDQKDSLKESLKTISVRQEASVLPSYTDEELNAAINAAKNNLLQQEKTLKKYTLTVPLSGIVLNSYVKEGELIKPNQDVIKVASDERKFVVVEIDEQYLNNIKIGDKAYLTSNQSSHEKVLGEVVKIAPIVKLETGTIEIKIEILDHKELFLQNMTVRVDLPAISFEKAIIIPGDYIVEDNGLFVFMKNDSDLVVRKEIEVYNKNLPKVYVLSGLNLGDIILNPYNLSEGDKVQVKIEGDDR